MSTPGFRPAVIGVGGFTSNIGKTTLVCELLHHFSGWEAIKTTRGHYRSCGKDPHTCCVSDLLDTEPVIRSGRELTDTAGKDTGRYWAAGAANVHWVIATDEQVAAGIQNAIARVEARGVIVEGNSFAEYVCPDFFIMVARPDDLRIKPTARRALGCVSAFYFSEEGEICGEGHLTALIKAGLGNYIKDIPIFSRAELPQLINRLLKTAFRELAGKPVPLL